MEAMTGVLTQPVGLFPYCRKFVHHFLAEEGCLASIYDINHTMNFVGQRRMLPEAGTVGQDGRRGAELGDKKNASACVLVFKQHNMVGGSWIFCSFYSCGIFLRPGNDLSHGPDRR